jgi:GGDEF domain-containing protein
MFFLSSEEKGIIFSEMVSEFGEVLKNTLRKTDIIFQWQQNRYFALLPLSAEKDADLVIDRIMNKWSESEYNDRIKIRYEISLSRKERYESKEQ